MKKLLASFLLLPSLAFAQNPPVIQSGQVTPGHSSVWITNGVIGDGGVPGGPIFTGSTTLNDFACVGATGTIIDCGLSATGTNNWTAQQNFNGGITGTTATLNGGPLAINPTPGSTIRGVAITQSGPSTSVAGPIFFNDVQITSSTTGTGAGLYGLRPVSDVDGLLWQYNTSGSVGSTQVGARFYYNGLAGSAVTGDAEGLIADAFSSGSTSGILHGGQFSTAVNSGGTAGSIEGSEHIVGIFTGGSTPFRFGIAIGNAGDLQGTTLDAAIAVNNYHTGNAAAFQNLIALESTSPGVVSTGYSPLSTTANFFFADTAYTVANIFNLSTMTVTGNILNFPHVTLSGAGALLLNLNATAPPTQLLSGINLVAADSAITGFTTDTFATNSTNLARRANGTNAAPTRLSTGDVIGSFVWRGYDASPGYSTGNTANLTVKAGEDWIDATHHGTTMTWSLTPNASATNVQALQIFGSGGVGIGTAPSDPGTGAIVASTAIKSAGPTAGIGYATGAGGAVTQITSRTTGVTLNTVVGAITLFSAAGSASAATFTVTDSAVVATDTVNINQKSGTNLYQVLVTAVAAGSFNVTFYTTGGTSVDAPVFNFAVIKGVAS